MPFGRVAAAMSASALLAGCASIVDGSTQPIYVATTPVSGATCTFSNERGSWSVTTPGTIVVKKSTSMLSGRCKKDGWQDATDYIPSSVPSEAAAAMALPYVGILEAAVDASTGAANEYPNVRTIAMKPADAQPAIAPVTDSHVQQSSMQQKPGGS